MPRLDLRDPTGLPDPFLTGRQNAVLDSAALKSFALNISPNIAEQLLLPITQIAGAETEQQRSDAFSTVVDKPPPHSVVGIEADAHRNLADHSGFCALARALIAHSLLWLRVDGWPEDRAIVKFSYDVPLDADFGDWSRASFGLEPFVFEFDVPHLGDTSSYHCNVVAPAPLEVVRAELGLFEPQAGVPNAPPDRNQVRHHVDSTHSRPHSKSVELYTGVAESQAKFYSSGNRTGLKGNLWVAVLIQSQGLLRGALGVGAATFAILLSFTIFLSEALQIPEAAVAVLLISPAVLGYLSIRPSEEALAGGFLVGLRRVIILSGVPPVAAATALALSERDASLALYLFLGVLTLVQAGFLSAVLLAYLAGRRWRKRYRVHPDATLVP